MTRFTPPEWIGPIGTGLFGTAYAIGDGRSLVLVGSPGAALGSQPDRTWPWIIMRGRVRDFAFEETLRTNDNLTAITSVQVLDSDRLFTTAEKDLGTVLQILMLAAQARTASHPGRKAAM
jgi:hypothetical protein